MPKSSNSSKWIYVRLSPTEHIALMRRASSNGQHISEEAADYIRQGLIADARESDDVEMRIFCESQKVRRRDALLAQLECIAVGTGDDAEETEKFEQLCIDAGFDPQEVMASAQRTGGRVPVMVSGAVGKKIDEAQVFIAAMLRGGPVSASTALASGIEAGFGETTMNQAKRRLGVKSVRCSNEFTWVLPENEQGEQRLHD